LTPSRKYAAVLLATLAAAAAAAFSVRAQPQGQIPMPARPPSATAPPMNPNVIVLDPAHGGQDNGATLGDNTFEKNVSLSVANRLKESLTAAGFTVIETRVADSGDPLTTDQRAEVANRTHAGACIVIHATTTGSGVHVYTSTLQPQDQDDAPDFGAFVPIPWDTAQAAYVRQSLNLASGVSAALSKDHLPPLSGHAPLRPLDNLMCPAIAIELAPLPAPGVGATPVTDASYQQQVATTLTRALKAWRDRPADSATEGTNEVAPSLAQAKAIAAAEAAGRAASTARSSSAPAAPQPAQRGTQ
jgi:N-acetylmuramoyl-L-alanine amidase